MSFTSAQFMLFLPLCIVAFFVLPKKWQPVVLLVASYAFYASQGLAYVLLLLAATAVTYCAAHIVSTQQKGTKRKAAFVAALLLCLGSLCFFKYYNFFNTQLAALLNVAGIGYIPQKLTLLAPLGISFYTFQSLGYLIDVYQHVMPLEKSFVKYAAFVSFFPCVSSGPIERGTGLLPQLNAPVVFEWENFAQGVTRILIGFFKKYVVAETLGQFVNVIYGDLGTGLPSVQNFGGPFLLMASLMYSYQIYCDFSGYSDIAIGTAKALGFTVMENFTRPFAAKSYTELWARWHISLTSWFRDYIFTPLAMKNSGGRCAKLKGLFNLFIIFPISGLWHGAAWTYIVWGALNGLYMVIGKITVKKRRKWAKNNLLYKKKWTKDVIQIGIVYLLFTSCIIFFRAPSLQEALYIYAMLPRGWGSILAQPEIVVQTFARMGLTWGKAFLLLFGIFGLESLSFYAAQDGLNEGAYVRKLPAVNRAVFYYICLLLLAFCGVFGANQFIYFNF
ncbi:MAG: hypothetical protein PHG02_02105 [Oscillospiraceae bacterium]|nr:hypothetical protein [Oscillospiraceae bacterium]